MSQRDLARYVKSQIDIRSFFGRYVSDLPAAGAKAHARCPIPSHKHQGKGSPELSLDLDRGLFHCFGRDEGGDIFRFYELMHGVPFQEAVVSLGSYAGFEGVRTKAVRIKSPRFQTGAKPTADSKRAFNEMGSRFLELCENCDQREAGHYLAARGISLETARAARVTYFPLQEYENVMLAMQEAFSRKDLIKAGFFNRAGRLTFYKHRLVFPFLVEGQVEYLQARAIDSEVEPRWLNMRGSVPSLYNLDSLATLSSGEIVYLVEGFTDTLTLMSHGFNVVGIVGSGGLKEDWVPLLGRFRIVSILDNDAAGNTASDRYCGLFGRRELFLSKVVLPTDVNDFFRTNPAAPVELVLRTEIALDKI